MISKRNPALCDSVTCMPSLLPLRTPATFLCLSCELWTASSLTLFSSVSHARERASSVERRSRETQKTRAAARKEERETLFSCLSRLAPSVTRVCILALSPPQALRFSRKADEAGELETRETGDEHAHHFRTLSQRERVFGTRQILARFVRWTKKKEGPQVCQGLT